MSVLPCNNDEYDNNEYDIHSDKEYQSLPQDYQELVDDIIINMRYSYSYDLLIDRLVTNSNGMFYLTKIISILKRMGYISKIEGNKSKGFYIYTYNPKFKG